MKDHPPRLLIRLLEGALPPGVRGGSIVGDLLEEWHGRQPGAGRTAWFSVLALSLAARYVVARGVRGSVAFLRSGGHAVRRAVRDPLQAGLTVLALGIGIAAPATMFSIVQGLTGELAFEEPDRVLHVGRRFTPDVIGIAPLDWLWPGLEGMEGLESVGVYSRTDADLSGARGPAARLEVARVSPGVLEAFRVSPALGRTFDADDPGGDAPPVILGWELWRDRFGADREVLGSTVRLNGAPRIVVGVLPEGFAYPGGPDLWAPLDPDREPAAEEVVYQAVVRMAEGATLQGIEARIDALNVALEDRGEEVPPAGGVAVERWKHSLVSADDRRMLSVLVVVVGFVLVIACADVLNLLLARALARSRATAVRVALGAGRARIVGDHLAEALVLSLTAGVLGLALTVGVVEIFERWTAGQLAHWMDVRVDLPVLLFGAGMVAVAALGTGVVPGIQASRLDVRSALGNGGRTGSAFRLGRLGRILVTGEIALSCTLLVVAGLWVKAAIPNLGVQGDFATSSVLTARYELRQEAYDREAARTFHRRLLERARSRPGVAEAAVASHLPGLFSARRRIEVDGSDPVPPEELPRTHVVWVSPSFFSTLQSQVLRGRGLRWEDGAEALEAVVVNEAFVAERLDGRNPLDARVRMRLRTDPDAASEPWARVVGVVPALGLGLGGRVGFGARGGAAGVYLPLSADPTKETALLVRAAPGTDPLSLVPDLRDQVSGLDPDLALWDANTLAGEIREIRAVSSIFAALFVAFGLTGLLLAAVGLYGLMAFGVRRRSRELGVRIALGAAPLRVLRTAVGRGLLQVTVGLVVGLGLAALVAPLAADAFPGVDPLDPRIYALVAGALALTGVVAALNPARRALGLDPVEALRSE